MLSMTIPMAMPLPIADTRRRTSIPHLNTGDTPAPHLLSATYLSEEERATFIVASSTRRPSVHQLFPTPTSSSPPCASYSSSSAASHGPGGGTSPILTPFQWTSDLRQYIMTDIGPQPSNSQMPTLRSHSHLVRQVSSSKISPVVSVCGSNLSSSTTGYESSTTSSTAYSRYSTIKDLCTIPQDEILPPMDVPLEKRFAHEEWDDEDE